MNFPGGSGGGGGFSPMGFPSAGGYAAGMSEAAAQEAQMIRTMQAVMESCPGKTVMSGVLGFGLGGAFGLFMSSMRYDTPLTSTITTPSGVKTVADLSVREQLKHGLKDMGKQSFSSAKNFGMIGAVFTASECTIEGLRAKNDVWNGVWGGCATGGALSLKHGPQAAALGCAGFAAFSTAIEYYMRMPEDEKRSPVV